MEISAALVRQLREKTGLPMMECKKALEEAQGNEAQAIEILRKKGMAQLTKRAGNLTAQGRLYFHGDPAAKKAVLLEMLCETAPVADTEDFNRLGKALAEAALKTGATGSDELMKHPMPGGPATIEAFYHDVVNRIRENIKLGRVGMAQGAYGHYLHHDGHKGVLVEFSEACPAELAADVCMHITALRPLCTRREEVPKELVDTERRVAQEAVKDKPPQMQEKIITGKIDRWYSETVLLEQPFVKEEKKSVAQVLKEKSGTLTVNRFVRLEIGEA